MNLLGELQALVDVETYLNEILPENDPLTQNLGGGKWVELVHTPQVFLPSICKFVPDFLCSVITLVPLPFFLPIILFPGTQCFLNIGINIQKAPVLI